MGLNQDTLRAVGLKSTLPRRRILQLLQQANEHHLSAESIYQALHDVGEAISLATVYRVLTQFEAVGIVRRHHFESDQAVFELDHGEHHDHIVCTDCGSVVEFFDDVIEKRQEEIAKRSGFLLRDHVMCLYGLCASCQSA